MEIPKLAPKNIRYLSNHCYSFICTLFSQHFLPQSYTNPVNPSSISSCPCYCRSLYTFSSTGSLPVSRIMGFGDCNSRYTGYTSQSWNIYGYFRGFNAMAFDVYKYMKMGIGGIKPKAMQKQVVYIIDLVIWSESNLEAKLDSLNVKLSMAAVIVIFHVLNCEKVSALHFFHWIRNRQPELRRNSDVCSMIIDNCGYLDDYDAMRTLLNDFSKQRLCLTEKAFGFLTVLNLSGESAMESTQRMIDMLCEVGGSCYGSGVYSLVEMFGILGSYDMAEFVMKRTEKKISYYNVLIRQMCKRCDFKRAREMLEEMRKEGCLLSTQINNYLISCLLTNGEYADACKVLAEMLDKDCPPDALTFEIFICHSCNNGNTDIARQFLDEMAARGLEPRLSTHAALIKGFFNSQQFDEAYRYVVYSDEKYKCSSCTNYSLLARLHQKSGNLVIAQNVLSVMIKKGLRPYFKVYMKVLNRLEKSGRESLTTDLREQFQQLHSTPY